MQQEGHGLILAAVRSDEIVDLCQQARPALAGIRLGNQNFAVRSNQLRATYLKSGQDLVRIEPLRRLAAVGG